MHTVRYMRDLINMAGIGFELKKLFGDDVFTKRIRAYIYSTLVSVGPWITTVIVLNIITLSAGKLFSDVTQKDLFMGTVVYSFVFSQILTAPWQMLIVRFLSDKMFSETYDAVKPSFIGLSKILLVLSGGVAVWYYSRTELPVYYIFFAIILFLLISMTWIIMVYLSAVKNYAIIAQSFIYGGISAVGLAWLTMRHPIGFPLYKDASNLLLSYTAGIAVTFAILLMTFLKTFIYSNRKEFEFLTYFKKVPSLFFIGFFYTAGLWADDILMWFSVLGVDVFGAYRFAPLYDNAVFIAFLTIIPSMVLFMVSIETEFYDSYRNYFGLITSNGPFDHIETARKEMTRTIFSQLIYVMEVQIIFTIICIILSREIFMFLQLPIVFTEIFKVTASGALCNAFVLIIMLILLYFEARIQALIISILLFVGNTIWTLVFIPKGIDYYGFGYFIGSFTALCVAVVMLVFFLQDITYFTFFRQPMFSRKNRSIIHKIAVITKRMIDRIMIKAVRIPATIVSIVLVCAAALGFGLGIKIWQNNSYSSSMQNAYRKKTLQLESVTKEKNIKGRESKSWSSTQQNDANRKPIEKKSNH